MAGEAIRKDRNMDNLSYVSKKLIAEYRAKENTDFKVVETAYIQDNNKFIIEYDGGKNSLYSVAKTFFESEPRSGSYTLTKSEYDLWKKIRKECDKENKGQFTSYELEQEEMLELDLKEYIKNSTLNEHEETLKALNDKELPF